MDPAGWDRLHAVFFAALELPTEERPAFLDEACAGDVAFRLEVEAVLAGHDRVAGSTPSGSAPAGSAAPRGSEGSAATHTGRRLGPYVLGQRIGRGGMGEVYRAERVDDQYRQQVAVKLLRSGLPADEMVRRFRIERQVLARLQHPNVAALLDGGVTEDGDPYLVMQYVDGSPITEHADRHQLSIAGRLRLFAAVCRAVQFAHSNLVVHRDLKPSNIFVGTDGQVRLLDFGIAKLLDPAGMGITARLTEDLLLLTPEHAAPEQIVGDPVTTATDVYALGVLLYELLTGTRPFRATLGPGWHRAVCEEEPARPSAALTTPATDGDLDVARVADRRGTRPAALRQALHGDLDHIVLMALRKEPERRYASAEQFAEDVERYLEGRPVLARRDTLGYRAGKFLRRNRLAASAAALLLLTLVGATTTTAYQARARATALAQAELERDKATSLAAFMVDVFRSNEPATARGRSITARELLDRAAARIDRELGDQPLLGAEMKLAIGRAYGALGHYDAAAPLFEDVLEVRRAAWPDGHSGVAEALDQAGRGRAALGRYDEARPLIREALAMRERLLGPNDTAVASTLTALASLEIQGGEFVVARSLAERAVAIHRDWPVPDGRGLAEALRHLWLAHNWLGESEHELPVAREALEVARSAFDEDDPALINVAQAYGLALEGANQFDSAAAVFAEVRDRRTRVLGPEHPDVSYAYHNLGRVLNKLGRTPEAIEAYRQALEIRELALGADHHTVAHVLHSYAIALGQSGEFEPAIELEERAIPILEKAVGAHHLTTLDAMEWLAQLYAVQGRDQEALSLLDELVTRGWAHVAVIEGAPFQRMTTEPRFQQLAQRVRETAASPR